MLFRFLVVLASCVFASTHVRADARVVPEARIESARGVALGTGVRASAASTQAQAENPANLVGAGVYHLEAFASYQPQLRRFGYGAAVADSMTSKLAAGLSLRALAGDNDAGDNSGWEGRLALGFPFTDSFSVGVAGRYSNLRVSDPNALPERPLPAGSTLAPDRSFKLKAFTLDASLTLRLADAFLLSALAYNLIDTESPLAPLMLGGSAAYKTSDGLSAGFDVLVDLNKSDAFSGPKILAGGGVEFLAAGVVPVRGGYQYDQGRKQHALTGGLGLVDRVFGVQVSLRQVVSGGKESTLMGAIQYFVQ